MKRIYLISIFILILILVISFTNQLILNPSESQNHTVEQQQTEAFEKLKEPSVENEIYTTRSGKTIAIENTHPVGASLSTVIIRPTGFETNEPITLTDIDPLNKVLLADLDKNGFDEIYLITQSPGSGSYGKIYVFASNRDKCLSEVSTENINSIDRKSDLFSGYRGHDSYKIEDDFLTLEFPVYAENNSNAQPTGGTRKLTYMLVYSESGYQLTLKP